MRARGKDISLLQKVACFIFSVLTFLSPCAAQEIARLDILLRELGTGFNIYRDYSLSYTGEQILIAATGRSADKYVLYSLSDQTLKSFPIREDEDFKYLNGTSPLISGNGRIAFVGIRTVGSNYDAGDYDAYLQDLQSGEILNLNIPSDIFFIIPQDINCDGSKLLFTAFHEVGESYEQHVYLHDRRVGITKRLMETNRDKIGKNIARFSADTRFVSASYSALSVPINDTPRPGSYLNGTRGIIVLDLEKNEAQEVTSGEEIDAVYSHEISGDGSKLYYVTTSSNNLDMIEYDVRTGQKRNIEGIGKNGLIWSIPGELKISNNGRFVAGGNFAYRPQSDSFLNMAELPFSEPTSGIAVTGGVSGDGSLLGFQMLAKIPGENGRLENVAYISLFPNPAFSAADDDSNAGSCGVSRDSGARGDRGGRP